MAVLKAQREAQLGLESVAGSWEPWTWQLPYKERSEAGWGLLPLHMVCSLPLHSSEAACHRAVFNFRRMKFLSGYFLLCWRFALLQGLCFLSAWPLPLAAAIVTQVLTKGGKKLQNKTTEVIFFFLQTVVFFGHIVLAGSSGRSQSTARPRAAWDPRRTTTFISSGKKYVEDNWQRGRVSPLPAPRALVGEGALPHCTAAKTFVFSVSEVHFLSSWYRSPGDASGCGLTAWTTHPACLVLSVRDQWTLGSLKTMWGKARWDNLAFPISHDLFWRFIIPGDSSSNIILH